MELPTGKFATECAAPVTSQATGKSGSLDTAAFLFSYSHSSLLKEIGERGELAWPPQHMWAKYISPHDRIALFPSLDYFTEHSRKKWVCFAAQGKLHMPLKHSLGKTCQHLDDKSQDSLGHEASSYAAWNFLRAVVQKIWGGNISKFCMLGGVQNKQNRQCNNKNW